MSEELKRLMERIARKEEAAEKIVNAAEEERGQIIDSAHQKKEGVFKKIKEEYAEKYAQWKAETELAKKAEEETIVQDAEEKLAALKKREQEIVDKVSDFLIEVLKKYGDRKR
jgi:vacuolar-type H+-ATPase subunit H